jgi:hypothetical protein
LVGTAVIATLKYEIYRNWLFFFLITTWGLKEDDDDIEVSVGKTTDTIPFCWLSASRVPASIMYIAIFIYQTSPLEVTKRWQAWEVEEQLETIVARNVALPYP